VSLRISEIFYSLQGESTQAGRPCAFVRLAGCDLACSYCDTPAARQAGTEMSVEEILAAVAGFGCPLVEVTGGEPLQQPETPELCRRLADAGHAVLLETNGSRPLAGLDPRIVRIMDVKTPGSGMAASFDASNLAVLRPPDQVKFVLTGEADYAWARQFLRDHPLPDGVEALFSPVTPGLEPAALARWILRDRLPVRLQVQLHKWLDLP
jgi:7-carboxy-7-deazaguanine synthase